MKWSCVWTQKAWWILSNNSNSVEMNANSTRVGLNWDLNQRFFSPLCLPRERPITISLLFKRNVAKRSAAQFIRTQTDNRRKTYRNIYVNELWTIRLSTGWRSLKNEWMTRNTTPGLTMWLAPDWKSNTNLMRPPGMVRNPTSRSSKEVEDS